MMASIEVQAQAYHTRRLARSFTPLTPKHHPLLDPDLPEEDVVLVPQDLCPRGQLNWELPKKARTNVHIMLKLSNKADELMEEFHEKLPLIDDVLNEWAEMRGASPTVKGLEQLRAQSSCQLDPFQGNNVSRHESHTDCLFNMVKNLETPGRSDVIYLTDAVEDTDLECKFTEGASTKIESVNWLDQGEFLQTGPPSAIPEALRISKAERKDNIPSNLQAATSESDQEAYCPSTGSCTDESTGQTGPFEQFWRHHETPFGPQVVLRGENIEPVHP